MGHIVLLACIALSGVRDDDASNPLLSHGPFLGRATPTSVSVWARATQPGTYTLVVHGTDGEVDRLERRASAESDLCLQWSIPDLEPDTTYRGVIARDAEEVELSLRTARPDTASSARLAFGSCAHDGRYPAQPVWRQMVASGAQAIVLLGDTPYIDSTELTVQRRRYREFYRHPDVAAALGVTPFHATWDDHDFGRNDTDGNLPGKQGSLQAFLEYHPDDGYGGPRGGVYSRFRRGPVEVFLLDTRWFSNTGPSFADAERDTLLGAEQWSWLTRGLAESTAPFKIIASGMIWNGATRPNKTDHWMNWPHERQALFRFLGERRIGGVVLVGGDIHRSRALRYPTTELVGYPLTELITSPMASSVIESANAPSPHLMSDVGHPQTFLLIDVDGSDLTARCLDERGGVHFEIELGVSELTAR